MFRTRSTIAFTLVSLGLIATTASADDGATAGAPPKTKTISIDGGLAMPAGDWGAGVGFGALARFEMPLAPKLALTVRAGYLQHLGKEAGDGFGGNATATASEIPVLGGVRYSFSVKPTSELYGAAELGFVHARISTEIGGMSQSGSDTNLGMSLGGGYRAGKLDVRGGLLFPDVGSMGALGVFATVGYQITAL
jgi:hypothetical protein